MTWTRDRLVRFVLAGLCVQAAPYGLSMAHAQGFGPDPFRPFNSQYDQYAYPISPETGGSAAPGRGMGRGTNQYQQWLTEQDAGARLSSERYGAGVRYWKVRSDFEEDKRERLKRRNARNDDGMGSITQKYLAYFTEEDPTRRAILLRDFASVERPEEREADRGEGKAGFETKRRTGASGRSGASSSPRGASGMNDEKTGRRIPPAPPLSRYRGSSRTQEKPSDVLDRVRRLDDESPVSERLPARKRSTRRQADPPPSEDE